MRTALFLLVISVIAMVPVLDSYAQSQPQMAIFVQVKVEDSAGNLVSYHETDRVNVIDSTKLNKLIDENAGTFEKSTIVSGGQKYDLIKATETRIHSSATIVSQEIISVQNGNTVEPLVFADHDGYPVIKGDKVTTYWTILRPAA